MNNKFNLFYLPFILCYFSIQFGTTFGGLREFPSTPNKIGSWIYQLQNLNINDVRNTAFDLVVMDYSSDGCEEGEYSNNQIDSVRFGPGGQKIVLAYMSIGEAEDYRFYWQNYWKPGNPQWLGPENPYWGGNYKVKFWDQEWQQIILNYTDRILTVDYPFGESEDVPHFEPETMMKIDSVYSKSISNGYVPYCTVRNLNCLTINPGHEPKTEVIKDQSIINPKEHCLYPNFPNPFNTGTVISVSVFRDDVVSLRIFDFLGREVENVWVGKLGVGFHRFSFWANDLPTGVYLVQMVSSKISHTRKMTLVK